MHATQPSAADSDSGFISGHMWTHLDDEPLYQPANISDLCG